MAEMHGELMELQEHLQRQLISQDNHIIRMKQELISLRGPLPNDLIPSTSSYPLTKNSFSQNRLISIWVPSVFLKGKGAEAHHLYQVLNSKGYMQLRKLNLEASFSPFLLFLYLVSLFQLSLTLDCLKRNKRELKILIYYEKSLCCIFLLQHVFFVFLTGFFYKVSFYRYTFVLVMKNGIFTEDILNLTNFDPR